MKQDEGCIVLCRKEHKKSEMDIFRHMIDQDYRVHWMMDGLPVVVRSEDGAYVTRGYPIGFIASMPSSKKVQHYLFNHVRIIVRYHEVEDSQDLRIVGFEVLPFSIKVQFVLHVHIPVPN